VSFEINYSFLDRATHKLAFSVPNIQLIAADIERSIYASRYKHIEIKNPVFITSLPRAGTTLLLEVLNTFSIAATHTYRDMPFVMAPLLFSKAGKQFQKKSTLKERLHADGVKIGYDSAEAFEEVIWKQFWPKKYRSKTLPLWEETDYYDEALEFFFEHMKKIISLRTSTDTKSPQYISKNNANIGRIDFINNNFDGAKIVVPIRDPIAQASSMLNQHKKFLDTHKKNKFALRYMRDIGHYEFGKLHRPIDFNGDLISTEKDETLSISYWLNYVTKALEHISKKKDQIIPFYYDDACLHPKTQLIQLLDRIQLDYSRTELATAAEMFHQPKAYETEKLDIPQALHEKAYTFYNNILDIPSPV
tara:strand:+ start:53774 stop:54859 length:1086 start_codon:yes stop_codon:yes gene_type:complete